MNRSTTCMLWAALGAAAVANAQQNAWTQLEMMPAQVQAGEPWIRPAVFKPFQLDMQPLTGHLSTVPMEAAPGDNGGGVEVVVPHPRGGFGRFRCVESPVMEPGLAAAFPEIRTYRGQGIDDPAAIVRFDVTPAGFHAIVLTPEGDYYVDPYTKGDTTFYASYFKREYAPRPFQQFFCGTVGEGQEVVPGYAGRASGNTLRTFRLACAADAEYTTFHGGTVAQGQAAIVTAINRVNTFYERDLAIHLTLIANNSSLVYTNSSTDPYTNNNGSTMLSENQANIDSVIGSANYDIGHVFSTGGGGIAGLGVVCRAGNKARGVTGLPSPTGDPFYIDYVCHEMGHEFGAAHTFNGTGGNCSGNRTGTSAYEPGSGSSIMCYAGICGADDLQSNGDTMFHGRSYDQIQSYVGGSSGSCRVSTATGNTAPTINAGVDRTIPMGTAFTLTALSAGDVDGDSLTYSWEEFDLGAAQALAEADNGASPIFRSFNPVTSPSRTFPRMTDVLDGGLIPGEKYPAMARTMTARCMVRDNRSGCGGVNFDTVVVNISGAAGPFTVTSPNTNVSWSNAVTQTVTWNVANTTAAPVSTANVNILLSTDGGLTFPTTLAANTPNDGSESVTLPAVTSTTARIRVEAVGNIYFDVSNVNFTITGPPPPSAPTGVAANPNPACVGGTTDLTATVGAGETVDWYIASCGGTLIGTGSPLTVNVTGQQIYRARARRLSDGSVSTSCTNVVLNTLANPSPPSGASASRSGFCADDSATITLTASAGSGTTLAWYTGACGGTLVGTGNNLVIASPTATTTYFARWETACSASTCASTTVTVLPVATAPASASASRSGFCSDDAGVISLNATGGSGTTLAWYAGSCGGAAIGTGNGLVIDSPGATTTYFARWENACGASACASTTVTVAPAPAVASVAVTGSAPFIQGMAGSVQVVLAAAAPAGGSRVQVTSGAFAPVEVVVSAGATSGSAPVAFTGLGAGVTATATGASCAAGSVQSGPFDVILLAQSFVAPGGSDSNRGDSAEAPVQSISTALARTQAGGTVNLATGEYTQCVTVSRGVVVRGGGGVVWNSGCPGSSIVSVVAGASLDMADVTLAGGSGGSGGGLAVATGASATLSRCDIHGCSATGNGGAISALGALELRDCTLAGNGGAAGGAVAVGGTATIVNCTISGNTSSAGGGGIAVLAGATVTLVHDTIAFNTAGSGGGVWVEGGGTLHAGATIFSGNGAGSGPDVLGALVTQGYNLVSDASGASGLDATDVSGVDAMLDPLADNTGPTRTHALRAGSPAIDAAATDPCVPRADQRGVTRPVDGNGDGAAVCDIGSFEAASSGVPCPADFNQDGGVDGGDVEAFFSAWEAGDASADVNFDGGIDGGDVETFYAAWEAGGC